MDAFHDRTITLVNAVGGGARLVTKRRPRLPQQAKPRAKRRLSTLVLRRLRAAH
jgi:hypothetical protein